MEVYLHSPVRLHGVVPNYGQGLFPLILKRKHLISKDAPSDCPYYRNMKCECFTAPQSRTGRYLGHQERNWLQKALYQQASTATKIDVLIIFSRLAYVRLVIIPA